MTGGNTRKKFSVSVSNLKKLNVNYFKDLQKKGIVAYVPVGSSVNFNFGRFSKWGLLCL